MLAVTENVPPGMNVTYSDYTLTIEGNLDHTLFEMILRTLTYDNRDNEPAGDTTRVLLVTLSDPPEEDVTAYSFVEIVLVNDAPTLSTAFGVVEYQEGDGAVRLVETLNIEDSDNTTLVSANVSFNIRNLGVELISVEVPDGSNIVATYDSVAGILTLNGEDTLESYAETLRSLTYQHTDMADPSLGTRVFFIAVFDGLDSSPTSSPAGMLFFEAVNDPPVVDLNGPSVLGLDYETEFVEDIDSEKSVVSPNATLIDVDNTILANVTISLAPQPDGNLEELVAYIPSDDGSTTRISGAELVLGANSVDSLQTILRSVQYRNLAGEPTPGQRQVTFVAHDRMESGLPAVTRVTVRDANDVPMLDIDSTSPAPGYATTFVEQGPPIFITARNVSIADGDVDATVTTVMVVIQNAVDGLDEEIASADPSSINITTFRSQSSTSFLITPTDGSLPAVEDLLRSLQYVNRRNEPSLEDRIISVSVSDGFSFSNSELVTIRVESVNENAPRFEQPVYSRSILEEQDPGASVATVRAVDEDSGLDGVISYAIVSSDPEVGEQLFRINETSGYVSTAAPLDRETRDFYAINISATDISGRGDHTLLEVAVLDVNDQTPRFQAGTNFDLSISEDTSTGATVATLLAVDDDIGSNAEVTYSLSSSSSSSSFRVLSGGQVVVAGPLDADVSDPIHFLVVVATDNGAMPLSVRANFTVTVTDVNDNSPIFTQRDYTGDLAENAPAGTSILTVTATDLDSGANGMVSYTLRNFADPPQPSLLFVMNETSGVVSNRVPLDREDPNTQATYFLSLFASDNGTPRRFSPVGVHTVTIRLTDANDIVPRFSANSYSATIDENVAVGSSVLRVSAVDSDMGSNGRLSYSIVPNTQVMPLFASELLFSIDEQSGDIFINGAIDFELQPMIGFTVQASDAGSPALTGSANVSIVVRDLNDNTPQFNQSLYEVSILETVPVGTVVLRLSAPDADSNANGDVTYSLADPTRSFTIDERTGALTNVISLDFETDCFYRLQVTASDSGMPFSRNSSAMVSISLLPVHDLPPVFSNASYTRSLVENLPVGTSILKLSATDGDILSCAETEDLSPSISGSGDAEDLLPTAETTTSEPQATESSNFEFVLLSHADIFAINAETGLITNLVILDREVEAQYLLRVAARDPQGLSTEVMVTVNVLDVNDNSPVFSQPSYTTILSENAPTGFTVLRVMAMDPDLIDQGRLIYSLRDQLEFFAIDNRTGDVYVAGEIDFETLGNTVDLIAIATDTGGNAAAAFVQLMVTDINDLPPVIETMPTSLTFTEGQVSLKPFPEITITDLDSFQRLCSATVRLDTPQSPPFAPSSSECSCANTSDVSSCTASCFEFLQLSSMGGQFPGAVLQSENGTTLTLVGNHTIAAYATAIRAIQYINLISNPLPQPRTVSLYVFDCQLPSNTLINTIAVQALNIFAPEVDLNGLANAGTNFSVTFRERGPQVAVTSPNATITDQDTVREREELTGLDVWIANPLDGDSESLVVSSLPFSHSAIVLTRNSQHSLSFAGAALLADYVAILPRLFYSNQRQEPNPSPRTINVVAREFHLSSDIATTTVLFAPSNDHPPVILTNPPRENRVTSFVEGTPGVALTAPTAVVSDADSAADLVAELQVHVVTPSQDDLLYWADSTPIPAEIVVDRVSNSSVVFRGLASPESYQTIVRALAYRHTGDEFDAIFPPKFVYLEVTDSRFSTFSAVQIVLIPVNDQMPVFVPASFRTDLFENATVGTSVLQVTATDGDRFSENDIVYSIQSGNEQGFFSIFPENGTIFLTRSLDFETTQVHRLIVAAVDQGFEAVPLPPPSTAVVTINLRDVNDEVPMFSVSEYNATVDEGSPIGTVVLQVFATDRDSPQHSALEFELAGTTDFAIGRQSGVIVTSEEIDRERVTEYVFYVIVRNPGTTAFDTARVSIDVVDLDDNPPLLVLEPSVGILQEPETLVPLATNLLVADEDPNPSLDYAIIQILSRNSSNSSEEVHGQLLALTDSDSITVSGNGSSKLVFVGESRPLSEYMAVLRGVVYQDSSPEPADVERVIAYQVGSNPISSQPQLLAGGSETISNISLFIVRVSLINDNTPELSLDTRPRAPVDTPPPSGCAGVAGSYAVDYLEDSGAVPVTHSSLAITDSDSGENFILYAVVEIVNAQSGSLERISADLPLSSPISYSEDSNGFRLILSGSASLPEYEAALRLIRYLLLFVLLLLLSLLLLWMMVDAHVHLLQVF